MGVAVGGIRSMNISSERIWVASGSLLRCKETNKNKII